MEHTCLPNMDLIPKHTFGRKLSTCDIGLSHFVALSIPLFEKLTYKNKEYIRAEIEKHHKNKLSEEVYYN